VRSLATCRTFSPPSAEAEPAALLSKRRSKAVRRAPLTIKGMLEIVNETLWAALLVFVIGFLVWKMPQISSTIDGIGGASRHAAPATVPGDSGQIRELESRIARYEAKLAPIEHNYAQLKQRHSDLQKAYDALRRASAPEAFGKAPLERSSVAAP